MPTHLDTLGAREEAMDANLDRTFELLGTEVPTSSPFLTDSKNVSLWSCAFFNVLNKTTIYNNNITRPSYKI